MIIYLLDGKDMTGRRKAYRIFKQTFGFPDWFGADLDGLYDCLCELKADETAIVFVNTEAMRCHLGPYAEKVLICFRDLSDEYGFTWIEKQ